MLTLNICVCACVWCVCVYYLKLVIIGQSDLIDPLHRTFRSDRRKAIQGNGGSFEAYEAINISILGARQAHARPWICSVKCLVPH